MTQEERQLLLKDLCARLPYGVIVQDRNGTHVLMPGNTELGTEYIKPYLRPLSSMTEEEFEQMVANSGIKDVEFVSTQTCKERMEFYFKNVGCDIRNLDWLNAHQFDYRGLIPMGLALEAPEEMYKWLLQ